MRLAELKTPGMSTMRFRLMLDGHLTAWNTWHLVHQVADADPCDTPLDCESPYIDDLDASGALTANAGIDIAKLIAAGHEIGHRTHCHQLDETVASIPDHLYWMSIRAARPPSARPASRAPLGRIRTN